MIKSFSDRTWAKKGAIFLSVVFLWVLVADEHYAGLIREEQNCIVSLLNKTGAKSPYELDELVGYQYVNCLVEYREWGVLERLFVFPGKLIRADR